jgi:enoyl-CoA hydratase/carnithine racemase
MTCDRFTSVEALRWGFGNHVPGRPGARSAQAAAKLLAKDRSLAMTKSATAAMER